MLLRTPRRLRGRLSDERGIALVMALGFMTVLAISTAALATLVTSNEKAFSRDREETRALNIAEAGVNVGLAYLNVNVSDLGLADGTLVPAAAWQTGAYDGGSYRWRAVRLSHDSGSSVATWQVTSVGTSPTGTVSRQVSVKTTATTSSTSFSSSQAWTYGLFVASPTGCTTMSGGIAVTMSVYIRGDLCFNGAAGSIGNPGSGPKTNVYVGGKVIISSNSGNGDKVGNQGGRIGNFTSVGGCKGGNGNNATFNPNFCGSGATPPDGTSSKIWADNYSSAQLAIAKPTIDPEAIYASGDWQHPVCSSGSFTFDGNATRNTSVGDFTLMPSSSFDCTVYTNSFHTTVRGRLKWDNAAKQLTAQGTIYVDGNLKVAGSSGSYATPELVDDQNIGATLYVNGSVDVSGGSALCGPGATVSGNSCNGLWVAHDGALAVIAVNAGGVSPGWKMIGTAEWNVIAYVVGGYDDGGSAKVTGPIITDTAVIHGSPDTTDVLDPPDGAPGAAHTTQSAAWGTTLNGSWAQSPVSP